MVLMAPKDENELRHMILSAFGYGRPVAIRFPKGRGHGVPVDGTRGDSAREGRTPQGRKGPFLRPGEHGRAGPRGGPGTREGGHFARRRRRPVRQAARRGGPASSPVRGASSSPPRRASSPAGSAAPCASSWTGRSGSTSGSSPSACLSKSIPAGRRPDQADVGARRPGLVEGSGSFTGSRRGDADAGSSLRFGGASMRSGTRPDDMKERADQMLVRRGLAESREKARRLIMAGLVYSGEERVDKPGIPMDAGRPSPSAKPRRSSAGPERSSPRRWTRSGSIRPARSRPISGPRRGDSRTASSSAGRAWSTPWTWTPNSWTGGFGATPASS